MKFVKIFKRKDIYTIIVICLTVCSMVILWMPAITLYVNEFFKDQNCIEQGGSFDYEAQICDYQKAHTYTNFQDRHPEMFAQMSSLSVLFVLFGVTLLLMKRKKKDSSDTLDKMEEVE